MPGGRCGMPRLMVVAVCSWLTCIAADASAQRMEVLGVGPAARESMRAPRSEVIGAFVRPDTVTFAAVPDGEQRERIFPLANIAASEGAASESSLRRAWRRGSIIGGIAGYAIGGAAIVIGANMDRQQTCDCMRKHALIAYLLTPPFAAGTAALGGWISAHTRDTRDPADSVHR